MKIEKVYPLLNFVLMPVSTLLAVITLPFAFISLANPTTLFGAFIFICVLIYLFKSTRFFRRNILPEAPAKANIRDWIRINSFISLFFIFEIISSMVLVLFKPSMLMNAVNTMAASISAQTGQDYSSDKLFASLKGLLIFFTIYAVLLLVHIILSHKLLRKYKYLLTQ